MFGGSFSWVYSRSQWLQLFQVPPISGYSRQAAIFVSCQKLSCHKSSALLHPKAGGHQTLTHVVDLGKYITVMRTRNPIPISGSYIFHVHVGILIRNYYILPVAEGSKILQPNPFAKFVSESNQQSFKSWGSFQRWRFFPTFFGSHWFNPLESLVVQLTVMLIDFGSGNRQRRETFVPFDKVGISTNDSKPIWPSMTLWCLIYLQ